MDQIGESFYIRRATAPDVPALGALIELSVRVLQARDYTPEQIEGALGTVLGLDTQLIADGTYFVVEARSGRANQIIAGCGGWSKRKTLFGGDHRSGREDSLLDRFGTTPESGLSSCIPTGHGGASAA